MLLRWLVGKVRVGPGTATSDGGKPPEGNACERLIRPLEISAAILPVRIEEERIEPPIEIVMMRDITARARAWIELLEAPVQKTQ